MIENKVTYCKRIEDPYQFGSGGYKKWWKSRSFPGMIAVDTVRLLESDGWIGFPGACFRSGGWTKFAQFVPEESVRQQAEAF